jgi:hypothetical protein
MVAAQVRPFKRWNSYYKHENFAVQIRLYLRLKEWRAPEVAIVLPAPALCRLHHGIFIKPQIIGSLETFNYRGRGARQYINL